MPISLVPISLVPISLVSPSAARYPPPNVYYVNDFWASTGAGAYLALQPSKMQQPPTLAGSQPVPNGINREASQRGRLPRWIDRGSDNKDQ